MTKQELEDIEYVANLPYDWDILTSKTILISGGSGFIGSFLCNVIRFRNNKYHQNIKVISISRRKHTNDDSVTYLQHDICEPLIVDQSVDFIIHLASNTHPEQYKNDPVGTITSNVFGTYNLLMLAKEKCSKKFLLASSCEVYGEGKDEPIDELYCGYINCNTVRAGYNESKRVSESLCQSFAQQYGTDICIFRLARIFGPDTTKTDTKAMAQFIRNAINGEDIVLKSNGFQKYSYLYISDAVSGILAVLFNGEPKEAYNISADYDGMTLGQYAEYIASLVGRKVMYDIEENESSSRSINALLDNSKIKKIGFISRYSVCEGLERTIKILSHDNSL